MKKETSWNFVSLEISTLLPGSHAFPPETGVPIPVRNGTVQAWAKVRLLLVI